ncbi:MAG: ABC transporter substrate-binding protein [Alphaproteobacteria bacterium]|nr:ABC transporter substrate-binding protein [Alphaproteobacteria bacterium]
MSRRVIRILAFGLALALPATAGAETLKASHQFPGDGIDFRDVAMRMFAREVAQARVGLDIKVYPAAQLMRPRAQWQALGKGQLDLSLLPFHYGGLKQPALQLAFMPGIALSHAHAARLNDSVFLRRLQDHAEADGVVVLADIWVAGGLVSRGDCVVEPEDLRGKTIRASNRYYERMATEMGAAVAEIAPAEIAGSLAAGLIDLATATSDNLVQLRLYEQVQCLTAPGDHPLLMIYEPIVIARSTYEQLSQTQRRVLQKAADKVETWARDAARAVDRAMVEAFERRGVRVVTLTAEQAKRWRQLAIDTALAEFRAANPSSGALIDLALQVD